MRYNHCIVHTKSHSIIRQPPNLTLFSSPTECQMREVSLIDNACSLCFCSSFQQCLLLFLLLQVMISEVCKGLSKSSTREPSLRSLVKMLSDTDSLAEEFTKSVCDRTCIECVHAYMHPCRIVQVKCVL